MDNGDTIFGNHVQRAHHRSKQGIGREVARQLAALGHHVFLGARNAEAGRAAAAEIGGAGSQVTFLLLDVSSDESVEAARQEFTRHADSLDVLVNNAGIIVDGDRDLLAAGDDLLRKTFETNTLGPLRVTRAFASLLARSASPRLINVSSGGGQLTDGADGWAPA